MAKNWYPVIDILTCGEYLTSFRRLIYCRKAKKGICRRISRRNIRRYIFLALFHSCFNCTTCHCCGKRKSAMGYSAYAAILNRS